jgi:hypothetical protein
MKKTFCDTCGAPADDTVNGGTYTKTPNGEQWSGLNSKKGCTGWWQPMIVTTATFGFENHRQISTDSPDLCRPCANKLIASLITKNPDGKIHTWQELVAAADNKQSVIGPHAFLRPRPAAFVLNMNFAMVSQALVTGLDIYEPKKGAKKS